MMRTRVAAAVVALLLASAGSARGQDPPQDDAARRAAIAKLGRMAWSDVGKPVAFCDLDGTNVATSDTRPVSFLRWLPDGRRVVAVGSEHVYVVDAATAKADDLTAVREKDDAFLGVRLSPDGMQVAVWHENSSRHHGEKAVGYAVFGLASGKRFEIAPAVKEDWLGGAPPAGWAPDGTIVAVLGTTPETLVRFDQDGKRLGGIATATEGCRIRQVALDRDRIAYSLEGNSRVEVRDAAGAVLFSEDVLAKPTLLRWEEGGASLRLDTIAYDTHEFRSRRLVAGKPPEPIPETPDTLPGVVSGDGKWRLTTRAVKTDVPDGDPLVATTLLRVDAATGAETDLGPGSLPIRVGDVYVYWRVTVPNKPQPGPFFEHRRTIQGTDDLWAYDPKDGAVMRLSDRGFTARCWDIRANAAEPTKR